MITKNIELHIEELVLHGFSPGDRYRIGEAVEQELTRLLADRGVPQSLAEGGEIASACRGESSSEVGFYNCSDRASCWLSWESVGVAASFGSG